MWDLTDECVVYAGPKFKVMIKYSMDLEGQKEVQKELKDVEFELRNIVQSPAAQEVKTAWRDWMATERGQIVYDFLDSSEWASVVKETQDYVDIMKNSAQVSDTEIYIDNKFIPSIEEQANEAFAAMKKAKEVWEPKY